METESKSKYIEAWTDHVNCLTMLAFCNDKILSQRIMELRNQLLELIPEVANIKVFKEE